MPELSRRVQTFTDSVIRRMTRINDMTPGSINLSQGFPDFDPPKEILEALKAAAEHGPHQYSITFGAKNFRDALADMYTKKWNRPIDPDKEIVVTCGGTEAMMAAMMTVCNPGDKVAVFSPFYENYGQTRSSPGQTRSIFRLCRRISITTERSWSRRSGTEQRR